MTQTELLFPEDQFGKAYLSLPQSNALYGSAIETLGSHAERFEAIGDKRVDDIHRKLGKPIGRLDILIETSTGSRGVATCTASLIDVDKIITNHHCIPGSNPGVKIVNAEFRLGYLRQAFEEGESFPVATTPMEADRALDYSIIKVQNEPGKKYGKIPLTIMDVEDNESLFLVHHPAGQPQRLTRAHCGALAKNSLAGTALRHRCDTLPGSSGALIFKDQEQKGIIGRALVGIHHRGGLTVNDASSFNQGTTLRSIIKASKVLSDIVNAVPKDIADACKLYPSLCSPSSGLAGRGCCIGEKWRSVLPASLAPANYELGDLKTTSGNPELDETVAQVVARMSEISGVVPAVAFLQEKNEPNAFAIPEIIVPGTDATLLIGLSLLKQMVADSDVPGARMAAVVAHEFAHAIQYKRGLEKGQGSISRISGRVKWIELHADFLAGYYAGRRTLSDPSYPGAVVALTMHGFGDHRVDDPIHFGTPEERGAAVSAGYESAYVGRDSFDAAFEKGIEYVLKVK